MKNEKLPPYEAIWEDGTGSSPAPLSVGKKLLYGVGEASNTIKAFIFGFFLFFFYTSVLELPGTMVGIATAVGMIWDAVIDPLIGHLSDRARFRFGRRHAFMLVGAVGMGLSFFATFNPPVGLSTGHLFGWLLVTTCLLRTANSIFIVPYHALGAELSQDYQERTSITGFRAACALFATMVVAVVSFVVFFPDTTPGADPKFSPSNYSSMGLSFGLILTLAGLTASLGTLSERSRPLLMHPVMKPAANQEPLGFLTGLRESLRNRAFLVLSLAASLFFLASVINAILAIHFLTYQAGIRASSSLSLFQLSFYAGALPGVAFWVSIARKTDKHRLFFGATVANAVVMAGAYGLVGEGNLFGTGNMAALLVGHGIAGVFASALWVLPASMIADIADQDEIATGRRREGTFFGIFSFFQQQAASLALLITGVLVDGFAGLVPGQVEQSIVTIERLAMLFGLLPAALLCLAALLILKYSLGKDEVAVVHEELKKRRHTELPATVRLSPTVREVKRAAGRN